MVLSYVSVSSLLRCGTLLSLFSVVLSETSVVFSYVPVSSVVLSETSVVLIIGNFRGIIGNFRGIVEVCHHGREFRIPSEDLLNFLTIHYMVTGCSRYHQFMIVWKTSMLDNYIYTGLLRRLVLRLI